VRVRLDAMEECFGRPLDVAAVETEIADEVGG
jgi:hypothetical protein